jgi:tetratricopeptide (TPR) repeat protein
VVLLAACAAQRPAGESVAAGAQAYSDTRSAVMYELLAGELAGGRGEVGGALEHYLAAAERSEDPGIARRALQISLFARNDAAARRVVERWVALEPRSAEARHALGMLQLHAGEREAAVASFDRALSLAPGRETWQQIVVALAREEDKPAALALMAALAAHRAQDAEAHYAHAQLAQQFQQYPAAIAAAEAALRLKPEWLEARLLRARALIETGQTTRAVEDFRRAVQARPTDRTLRFEYARLLLRAGQTAGARAEFERLLRASSQDHEARLALALLEIDAGHLKLAEQHLRTLLRANAHPDAAAYFLGRIAELRRDSKAARTHYGKVSQGDYLLDAQLRLSAFDAQAGHLDQARERLRLLMRSHPQEIVRLILAEGELLTVAGRHADAYALYDQALARQPDNSDLRYARALVAEHLDRLDVAESDLRAILDKEPDNVHALNALGYTLADRTTRYQEALGYVERALKLRPGDAAIMDSLGWVHFRLGHHDEAVKLLRRAFEQSRDGEVGAHLGEVLWTMGDQAGARHVWDEARSLDPDDPLLKKTLERLKP